MVCKGLVDRDHFLEGKTVQIDHTLSSLLYHHDISGKIMIITCIAKMFMQFDWQSP